MLPSPRGIQRLKVSDETVFPPPSVANQCLQHSAVVIRPSKHFLRASAMRSQPPRVGTNTYRIKRLVAAYWPAPIEWSGCYVSSSSA